MTAFQSGFGQLSKLNFTLRFFIACSLLMAVGCSKQDDYSNDGADFGQGNSPFDSPDGKLVLHRKSVIDPAKRNMTSHTIFVPEGWEMEGNTQWPHPSVFRMLPSPKIVVSSPDGVKASIHHTGLFSDPRPSAAYQNGYGISRPRQFSNDGGNIVMYRPDSFGEWESYFRETVIPERHPNANNIQIVKVAEVEEVSQILIQRAKPTLAQVERANQQARFYGMQELQRMDIKALMIEANFEEDGVDKEFVALIGLHSIETQMQGMVQVRWSVEPNISYVAPYGQLESSLPVLFAITGSMRPTPEWTREVQRYVVANTPRNSPRPSNSSVNVGNTFSDILDISHNGFRNRMNSGDTSQQKYVNSIHETSNYSSGGTSYNLPSGYNHVYTDDNDTIILTNNSLFDPGVELGSSRNWTKMSEQ